MEIKHLVQKKEAGESAPQKESSGLSKVYAFVQIGEARKDFDKKENKSDGN